MVPKIVINLPWIYEKLSYKGESYRFRGWRDPSVQTDKHPVTLLYGLASTPPRGGGGELNPKTHFWGGFN